MKKVLALMMAVVMMFAFCACGASKAGNDSGNDSGEGGSFKMTTAWAAEQTAKQAINEWMSTKMLSFECEKFEYVITKTERSDRSFSGDAESGMMWYNAYGTVVFYNDYGDELVDGDFSIFFGHNGVDSTSYIGEETQVNLNLY